MRQSYWPCACLKPSRALVQLTRYGMQGENSRYTVANFKTVVELAAAKPSPSEYCLPFEQHLAWLRQITDEQKREE